MAAANPAATALDYALQLPAGSSAALACGVGTAVDDAARIGFYGDTTASAEKFRFVVGAQTGPYFQRNASTVDAYFPGAVIITGNLTVNGSTTSITSTVVDVSDRVIRVNKSSGADDPVPAAIAGISVYRGAVASVARDHYGLFWDESATKWKLAVNTGGDDLTLGAYLNFQALAITGTTITASSAFAGGSFSGTTGTFSSLTTGRITTAGTSGLLQDFAGLAIVGTPSATAPSTGTNGPGTLNGQVVQGADSFSQFYTVVTFGNSVAKTNGLVGYACQGTAASPGATITGDNVNHILRGHDGTNYTGTQAQVQLTAASTWTPTSRESNIVFAVTPNASATLTTAGRIDSTGALVWGTSTGTSSGTFSAGALRPHIQTASTSANNAGVVQTMWNNAASGPTGILAKSRSGTVGTQGVITTGDTLGTMSWQGDDGTNFIAAAQIIAIATGTIATGQVPGILRFDVANASGTLTRAMAIDSTQVVLVGPSTAVSSALYAGGTLTPQLQVVGGNNVAGAIGASITNYRNATTAGSLYFGKSRSSTIGTMTVVTTGDALGQIDWQGADGTNFVSAAQIIVTCTGTIAGSQIPGNMVIKTANTSGTLTTALTIDNTQKTTVLALVATSVTNSGLTSGRVPVAGASGLMGDFSTFTYTSGSGISVDGITIADAKNIVLNTSTGTKLGTGTTQKLGLWNAAPVAQYATTGTVTGFTAATTTPVLDGSTFTGNTGSTAYTIGDIVRALKLCGVMAA